MSENQMNINAHNVGRIYAVYEAIFHEGKIKVNQFENTKTHPSIMLPRLEDLARGCSCYSKYRTCLSAIYSEISEIPKIMTLKDKAAFTEGYYHQFYEMHCKK